VDGDPTNPNAVFVGVMSPLTGANSEFGLNQYQVVQSAAAEWNANITGQANTHPIVTIGCDERADPAGTSTFLASRLQVAAIFGPIYDVDFAAAAPAATLNGTIMAGSRADDPNFATYPGAGKTIWSWQPNRTVQAAYLNNLVALIEPSIRASQGVSTDGGSDLKLAFVVATGDDTSSADFATLVEPTLTFNGKTTAANGTNYTRINVPFSFTTANVYTSTVASLVQAAPDFVIVSQEYDLLALVRAINNGWTGAKFPRFLFLTEDPSVDAEVELAGEKFSGKLDFVTWSLSAQEQQNASTFAVSFRTATGGDPASFSGSLYDAFYENAYAVQSVLDANGNTVSTLDPGAYSSAIAGFNAPGTLINVGVGSAVPNNIAQSLSAISASTDIDLDGASGPLEFSTSGTPIQNAELRCIKSGAGSVSASGVTFDGKTGAATGTYSCL
jgi:ABC-type branched-subunit amino acid transport system substrate-binding protein